jgi:hypothetical protein
MNEREVLEDSGLGLANKYNGIYCETSAKENQNIAKIFEELA